MSSNLDDKKHCQLILLKAFNSLPSVLTRFCRVPYALQEQAENELEKVEKHGVIKKTNRSCWAS